MLGLNDSFFVNQQYKVTDGESRSFIPVIERMADCERVNSNGSDLLDSGFFEPIRQVHLDSPENGTYGSADSRARQPAQLCQQLLMQIGDLLFRRQSDPHRFAKYCSASDR